MTAPASNNPFARYPHAGRRPLGFNDTGNGSFRTHYGLPVLRLWGASCAYCDRDLGGSYEAWLDASVEHVIPKQLSTRAGWPVEWTEDLSNHVICCRACNEFLNGFKVDEPLPANFETFAGVRDRVFDRKRAHARSRHDRERRLYEAWVRDRDRQVDAG